MLNDPILAVAVRAARRAASVVLDAARDLKRMPTHAREQAGIALAADTDAENAIIATLRAAFPGHTILGEETGETFGAGEPPGGARGYRWIIDAIDGKANFVHGFPYYAVSIALTHGNEITHAVVLDPVHDELFTSIRGKGAQLNGLSINVSACSALDAALVGTAFPNRVAAEMPGYLRILNALLPQCAGMRRAGTCALDLAYIAAGRLDGCWMMNVKPWELAAGALIVREAGGRIGDFAGGGEFLRTHEIIAAAPGVFNPRREAIAAAASR
jgi:myo-inositol-1(or 4)-monophosphatase